MWSNIPKQKLRVFLEAEYLPYRQTWMKHYTPDGPEVCLFSSWLTPLLGKSCPENLTSSQVSGAVRLGSRKGRLTWNLRALVVMIKCTITLSKWQGLKLVLKLSLYFLRQYRHHAQLPWLPAHWGFSLAARACSSQAAASLNSQIINA